MTFAEFINFLLCRTNPGVTKERDSVGYLGQIVRVKSETLEYREWVASVWSVDSAPLIKQSAPTYASIANRHVQTHAITSQYSSDKNATWNRSQSNLETLMTEGKGEPFVKHASVDCRSVRGMSSVQNSADSLAQDMIPEKIAAYETRTSVFGGSSKSLNFQPANNNELSCPSKGSLYSEAIKQSPTKTKQTFTSMPKTSAVTSTSKSKLTAKSSRSSVSDVTHMVKTVSSSARSSSKTCFSDPISKAKVSCDSGLTFSKTNFVDSVTKTKERDLQKTMDEQKSSPTSNSNVSPSPWYFEPRTDTGSVLFSYFTCLHTTTFIFLNPFALVEMISFENWGETNVRACKMFTSGCRPWLKTLHA